ncbi:hypothetical protein JCM10207_004025 [Rhodosporidiobolus poonsookiae]
MPPSDSDTASGSTLAEHDTFSPTKKALHRPPGPWMYDDEAREAEREMRDFGGDAPSPLPEAETVDEHRPLPLAHQPPTFTKPTRQRSRSGAATTGRPRSNSQWSQPGFPPLHLQDSAFFQAHRALSRVSRRGEARDQEEEHEEEEQQQRQEDPNKVVWDENDPENPQNWSVKYKWWVTVICAQATIVVTFASSAPSSATQQIAADFGVGSVVSALVTSLFLCGYCLGPLIWAPLSEIVGRRPIFVISLFIFALWQIGCALAKNIQTLCIMRFLAGTFAASPLTNAGGVIADIWDPVGRGKAMAVFSSSVFLGPVIGPIVGGFLEMNQRYRWPYIFWIIMAWGGFSVISLAAFLPETYHPALLAKRAKKLRKQEPEKNSELYGELERADFSLKSIVTRTIARPCVMLVVEPLVLVVTVYLSIIYGILYGLFSVFPIIFEELRGFNPGESGLTFIGVGVGTTIGAFIAIRVQRHYRELIPKWHGHPPPEERLWPAMVAAPLNVVGIFILGWTGNYPWIHWAVPAVIGGPLLGASFNLFFISFLSYLVEVYLMYSASALAANTIARSAFAAAFPLFITQMFSALGVGWGCSFWGFISLLLAPSPFLFYRYGWLLRKRSRFAPCLDIGMRERVEREQREAKERTSNEKAQQPV